VYDHAVRNAEVARGAGLVSGAVVGLHPAECVRLLEAGWGVGEVEGFMRWAVDLAARYVEEGRAVGLGGVWEAALAGGWARGGAV